MADEAPVNNTLIPVETWAIENLATRQAIYTMPA
jgi:hypothetical protein